MHLKPNIPIYLYERGITDSKKKTTKKKFKKNEIRTVFKNFSPHDFLFNHKKLLPYFLVF